MSDTGMAASENIVIARPDDWEQWISEIQATTDEGIWPHIDPDNPEPERGLRVGPDEPILEEFDRNARSYAQLSMALQNRYDHARKHYDQDMKYFQRQQDLLREVRKYISSHVSLQKKLLLERNCTVREWLVRLKEDTEPTENYMAIKVHAQYMESLKGLGRNTKINTWVDKWELAMKLIDKYKLPQASNGIWLRDLAETIKPLSDTLHIMYGQQAREPDRNKPSQYRIIAMQLRETFHTTTKKQPPTTRGSAFNADFGGEEASDNASEEPPKGKRGRQGGRKRTGTTSIDREASASKKPKGQTCAACNFKGHLLPECWTTFEHKRPDGYTPSLTLVKRVKDKLAKDKDLAAEVERITLQEGTNDEA
jgi:hypothetical protein